MIVASAGIRLDRNGDESHANQLIFDLSLNFITVSSQIIVLFLGLRSIPSPANNYLHISLSLIIITLLFVMSENGMDEWPSIYIICR